MNDSVPDIHQILEYRADTAIVQLLPVGLALLFLGLFTFALFDTDRLSAETFLAACVLVVAGTGIAAFALWRRSNRSKPVFVLSPMGVHYRIPWVKEFVIPWREIRGIDTIDITSWNWSLRNPDTMTFSDVTVILVPKKFYDAHIHVDSLFLRGPAWGNVFIPKGALVQVALHRELVSVEPRALREAVTARWHAFRDQPPRSDDIPARPAGASVPAVTRGWKRAIRRSDAAAPPGIAMGDNPKAMSMWEAVQVIIPLIGIAIVLSNLLGLWATEGQTKTREQRANWAEEERKMQEQRREMQKGLDETDRRIKEMLRRF